MTDHSYWVKPTRLCVGTYGVTRIGDVFPVRCGSWDCDVCAKINALHWAIKVRQGIKELTAKGEEIRFWTITLKGIKTPEYAFKILPHAWDKLRNRIQYDCRKSNKRFVYCAFVELHKTEIPHFHVITTLTYSEREARKLATASGFGHQLKVEKARSAGGLAWYISKYTSKSSGKANMPKNFRRVRHSEDFPLGKLRVEESGDMGAVVKQHSESVKSWLARVHQELPQLDISEVIHKLGVMLEKTDAKTDSEEMRKIYGINGTKQND